MNVKYFADTDTALLEFSDHPPVETREINENLYIDVDAQGRVVSVTIEHAHQSVQMPDFSYQVIAGPEQDVRA